MGIIKRNGKSYTGKANKEFFPIGYVYISTSNVDPSTYFGGTWTSIGAGRCLVGVDTSDTDFDTVKKTGGEKIHTLTVDEIPSHNHNYYASQVTGNLNWWGASGSTYGDQSVQKPSTNTGGGGAHNNLQPYLTVYMWERTA